jgi:hypothetical protein
MPSIKVDGREIELQDFADQDVSCRKLLGTAEGADFNHCLYLGLKYGKDFVNKVKGFKRAEAKNGGPYAVSFYE